MKKKILTVTLDDETNEYGTEAEIDGIDELNVISMLCSNFRKRVTNKKSINKVNELFDKAINGYSFYWKDEDTIGLKKHIIS